MFYVHMPGQAWGRRSSLRRIRDSKKAIKSCIATVSKNHVATNHGVRPSIFATSSIDQEISSKNHHCPIDNMGADIENCGLLSSIGDVAQLVRATDS